MSNSGKIKRILLRAPNWIGDAVMTLPAVESLGAHYKKLYKDVQITVLAKPWVVPIYENNSFVSDVIEYDMALYGSLLGKLKLIKLLKERNFHEAVLFQNAIEAAILARFSNIPKRIGYARDGRGFLLTNKIPFEAPSVGSEAESIMDKHQVYYYQNIVDHLAEGSGDKDEPLTPLTPLVPKITLKETELTWAKKFLEDTSTPGSPFIGIAPGASYGPAKKWPLGNFTELLNKYIEEYKAVPVILGGEGDSEDAKKISKGLTTRHINLVGKLTLRQSMAVMSLLNVFITNDSGPMHIASAMGVSTVALFGSTSFTHTGPLAENTIVVYDGIECSPCFKRTCPYGHYDCFKDITVDRVYKECEKIRGDALWQREQLFSIETAQ